MTTFVPSFSCACRTNGPESGTENNSMKPKVLSATRSQYAIHALDWIFGQPIFKSSDFVANSKIPPRTANRILAVLRSEGIVKALSEGKGPRAPVFVFAELLNIAEGTPLSDVEF